jgi:Putative metal-binding motif
MKFRMTMAAAVLAAVGATAVSACDDGLRKDGSGEEATGKVGAAISMPVPNDTDVVGFKILVTRVACNGEAFTAYTETFTSMLSELNISSKVTADGSAHMFADTFIPLEAGCYDIVSQPIQGDGSPSADCAIAGANNVVVFDGLPTEIVLVSQCDGQVEVGAIDVISLLNRPPQLIGMEYPDGKFTAHCSDQEVCAKFKDPDGDPLEVEWTKVLGLPGSTFTVGQATPNPDGSITQCVTVDHAGAGMMLLEAKAFDLMKNPAAPGLIRFEDYYATQQIPATSHDSFLFQAYGLSSMGCPCVPNAELCDGVDNDCDGQKDESLVACACTPGAVEPCYGGPAGTGGVGLCKGGAKVCAVDGSGFGACEQDVTPVAEVCGDGLDNDCNGSIENGCPCTPGATQTCYPGQNKVDVGVCTGGLQTCQSNGTWGACAGAGLASKEVCGDNLDNDCDGVADENCGSGGSGGGGGGALVCPNPGTVWYFGDGAGLDFSGGAPVGIAGPLSAHEGAAVLSCGGPGLIATNGATVYNALGQVMPNGSGMLGESSSTQAALLVPRPGTKEIYLFSTEQLESSAGPLHYSVVDMDLDGGLGDVDPAQKNLSLTPGTPVGEKMVSVKHQNGVDTWVIVHAYGTDEHMAYLVSAQGITGPVVSSAGTIYGYGESWGELAASPDGSTLATGIGSAFEIYDFDRTTGVVSTAVTLSGPCQFYGMEFSPNSDVLYGNCYGGGAVYQYDLSTKTAAAVGTSQILLGSPGAGAIERGPDGKLYIATFGATTLSVISQPDTLGAGAGLMTAAVPLQGTVGYGLVNVLAGSY